MLETVEGGEKRGRYSVIGMDPDMIWRTDGKIAEISQNGKKFNTVSDPAQPDTILTSLREIVKETQLPMPEGIPPMAAGLIGYLGYDSIRLSEKTVPDDNPDPIQIPTGIFMRPQVMLVLDSVLSHIYVFLQKNHNPVSKLLRRNTRIEKIEA